MQRYGLPAHCIQNTHAQLTINTISLLQVLDQGNKISKYFPHLSHCFGKQHLLIYLAFYHKKLGNKMFVMAWGSYPLQICTRVRLNTITLHPSSTPPTMVMYNEYKTSLWATPSREINVNLYHPYVTVKLYVVQSSDESHLFLHLLCITNQLCTYCGWLLIRIKRKGSIIYFITAQH